MRYIALFIGVALAALAVTLPASADQPQGIHISSILYGQPDPAAPTNPNRLAVSGCFAVTGAITDQGGGPQFDALGNIVGCTSPAGISGYAAFDGLGHLKSGAPNVLQAAHRMYGAHGTIGIQFEGKYGPIVPVGGRLISTTGVGGGWQITCGTGAYTGLQGQGTSAAVADFTQAFAGTGPVVVVHIDTGSVHFGGSAGC
jgi:hypothetical protein